ncbi:5-(carboxyamino)imidazole ribonucleotide synthase [Chamaesiphon minutus]|uniref:N5-carboxyaminoimidazole ribonucleotide synthase n=1 Tax=Chamaesiphon minutus (strain ATCC 27169 / PCC 6605) TaxID=1173020 RepID=K9UGR3_CHAP6|nr:5-(carboxyamino)imidazole ribonucleotide synthase [Chamaesiphon minutus]AFY93631.1 phosphoribosylaminoimidazole carboxylase, PurK protein [Chamaesiphon minutus PCC 6605]
MKRIGVIGGGQLAWMMASAAQELGIELVVQTPHSDDVAVSLAAETVLADVADVAATAKLATKCDVITFENEFVDLDGLGKLAATGDACFLPPLSALAPLLDKYTQRCYLRDLGLPVPKFALLEQAELPPGFEFPVVVKARRNGYDGQGTFIIKDKSALESLYHRYPDTPFLVEEFVNFDRELAVIAARGVNGDVVTYPILETQQENQVCRRVFTIEDLPAATIDTCNSIASKLLTSLGAVGIFGIELFATADGKVSVNEIAPRTHNSGHLTIEACATSQFSQLIRAVAGLPLGSTELTCGAAVMVNLLGYEDSQSDYLSHRQQISAIPNAYVHWYGKQSRIGRKLGHVTILVGADATLDRQDYRIQAAALARQVETIWYT